MVYAYSSSVSGTEESESLSLRLAVWSIEPLSGQLGIHKMVGRQGERKIRRERGKKRKSNSS